MRQFINLIEDVWHGGPHKINNFSTSFIGSGEGSQAYGWGLYFASSKEVAEFYQQKLSQQHHAKKYNAITDLFKKIRKISTNHPPTQLDIISLLGNTQFDKEIEKRKDIIDDLVEYANELYLKKSYPNIPTSTVDQMTRIIEKINYNFKGYLYKSEIPDSDTYLLWDETFSNQSDIVKDALDMIMPPIYEMKSHKYRDFISHQIYGPRSDNPIGAIREERNLFYTYFDNEEIGIFDNLNDASMAIYTKDGGRDGMPGAAIYRFLTREYGSDKQASLTMLGVGITGIKYLDSPSRISGKKTYNYVIFDENDVNVKNMYESEETDTETRNKSLRIFNTVHQWLTSHEEHLSTLLKPTSQFGGSFYVKATMVGLSREEFDDLIFIFMPKNKHFNGGSGTATGTAGRYSVITISVLLEPKSLKYLPTRFGGTKSTFVHEMTHYLLHKNWTGGRNSSADNIKKGNVNEYYNNASEMNSYYMEMTHNAITLAEALPAGHEFTEKVANYSTDELINWVKRYGNVDDFLKALTIKNKQKIDKRLSRFVEETLRPILKKEMNHERD